MFFIWVLIKCGINVDQCYCYKIFKLLVDSVSKEDLNLLFYVVKIIFFYVLEEILFMYWE